MLSYILCNNTWSDFQEKFGFRDRAPMCSWLRREEARPREARHWFSTMSFIAMCVGFMCIGQSAWCTLFSAHVYKKPTALPPCVQIACAHWWLVDVQWGALSGSFLLSWLASPASSAICASFFFTSEENFSSSRAWEFCRFYKRLLEKLKDFLRIDTEQMSLRALKTNSGSHVCLCTRLLLPLNIFMRWCLQLKKIRLLQQCYILCRLIFFLTAAALWLSGRGNDGGNPGPRPESIMAPSAGRIRPTGPARGSLCIYISSNKPST